jgi:hypothetical protein
METDDRIAFIRWLEDKTVTELREAGNDVEKQKQAFMQYFLRGNDGLLHWGELWDYLSMSDGNPLQRAGLYEDDEVYEATLEIIRAAAGKAAQFISQEWLGQTPTEADQRTSGDDEEPRRDI